MPMLKVMLDKGEQTALLTLSRRERRDPRAQAALIIRAHLEKRGLLSADRPQPQSTPAHEAQHHANTN